MAKNDFRYGGWNYCTLQCGMWLWIVSVNAPSGSTLQCGRWLCDDMPWNMPKRPPYWNLVSILTISPQWTCHSALAYSIHWTQKHLTAFNRMCAVHRPSLVGDTMALCQGPPRLQGAPRSGS